VLAELEVQRGRSNAMPSVKASEQAQASTICQPSVRRDLAAIQAGAGTLAAAGPFPPRTYKVLATWHPAFVLRSWSSMFDLRQDLRRAREEALSPVLSLPEVVLEWGPDPLLNV